MFKFKLNEILKYIYLLIYKKMNQSEQDFNDEEQNNNLSNRELFQLDDNIQENQMTNYQKIYQNPKNIYQKKEIMINNPSCITQSLAQKIIQRNNNLNITPITNDQNVINLNNTCPNNNIIMGNSINNNSYINKSNHTADINSNNMKYIINKEYESLSDDNEKLNELAKNIKENEDKVDQMNKTMNEIIQSKNKNEEVNDLRSFYTHINDIEKIQQENITLKADSLIYREDITHLVELNNKCTEELEISRKKILDLISRNNDIEKDINHKDYQINKLNEIITRLRLYENPDMEYKVKNNKTKEEVLHEMEYDLKNIDEENNKINNEKKILQEKIKDIIDNKNELNRNIILNNEQNNKMINDMDEKIQLLEREINGLSNENNLLNINNQKIEKEMEKIYIERNNYEDKYNKKKEEYDKLQNNYNNLNRKYQQLLYDNNRNLIMEQNKKNNNEKKIKKVNKDAINELFNKIQILKSKVKNERDIEY